ncbi:MAG: hypothetical protein KGL39_29615 [Patescibacteria group bacterium]|nr:hypothetical protein [Patescibacteria group bacterium]
MVDIDKRMGAISSMSLTETSFYQALVFLKASGERSVIMAGENRAPYVAEINRNRRDCGLPLVKFVAVPIDELPFLDWWRLEAPGSGVVESGIP